MKADEEGMREFDKDGHAGEMFADIRGDKEAARGSELKPMLEYPQSSADGNRSTIDTVLRENHIDGANSFEVSDDPAMELTNVFVVFGAVPLLPSVSRAFVAAPADSPDRALSVVHNGDKKVALVEDRKHDGDEGEQAGLGQVVVVAKLRDGVKAHLVVVGLGGVAIPHLDEIGRQKADRAEEFLGPAIVQVEVYGGELDPHIWTQGHHGLYGGLPQAGRTTAPP